MDCTHPHVIRNPQTKQWMKVPCGMCIACRIAKSREWTIRLMMEKDCWDKAVFLTLTYDDEHLPHTNCGRPTLVPDHLTKFWKRVRTNMVRSGVKSCYRGSVPEGDSSPLLRYFSCGEYGDTYKRPHYHAVVFGTDFGHWFIHHWQDGKPQYTTDKLCELWPYGFATVDFVEEHRCAYVAGYVQKKIYKDPWRYFEEFGCCVFPFQRISQGIGFGYYLDNKDDYFINLRPTIKGVSYSTPRYFLRKDDQLKTAVSFKSFDSQMRSLGAEQDALNQGIDLYASMRQREEDLKAKSRMRKGKL